MGDRSSSSGVRNIRAMFEAKNEFTTSPPSRGRSPAGSDGTRSTSSRPISKVRTSFIAVEKSGAFGPILGLRRVSDGIEANGVVNGKPDMANGHLSSSSGEKMVNGSLESLRTGGALTKVKEEEGGTTGGEGNGWTNKRNQNAGITIGRSQAQPTVSMIDAPTISNPASAETPNIGIVLKGSPFEPLPGKKTSSSKQSSEQNRKQSSKQHSKPTKTATPRGNIISTSQETKAAVPKATTAKLSGFHLPVINTNATALLGPRSTKSSQPSPVASLKTPISVKSSQTSKATPKASPKTFTRTTPKAKESESSNVEVQSKEKAKVVPKKQSRASLINCKLESKTNVTSTSQTEITRPTSTWNSGAPSTLGKPKISPAAEMSTQAPKRSRRSSTGFLKPAPKSPTRPMALPASATASTAASAAKTGNLLPSRSPSRASKTERKDLGIRTDRLSTAKGPNSAHVLRLKPSRISLEPERPRSSAGTKIPDDGFLARMMRPTASSASKTHEKLEPKSPPRKVAPPPSRETSSSIIIGPRRNTAPREEPEASIEPGALDAVTPSQEDARTVEADRRDDGETITAEADRGDADGVGGMATLAEPLATA